MNLAARELLDAVKSALGHGERGHASRLIAKARREFGRQRTYEHLAELLPLIRPNVDDEDALAHVLGRPSSTYNTSWEVVSRPVRSRVLTWRLADGGELMVRLSSPYRREPNGGSTLMPEERLVVDGFAFNRWPDGLGVAFESSVLTGRQLVFRRSASRAR